MPTADLNADLDCITRLLDHLWLQERLSQNTLDAYRRDLTKSPRGWQTNTAV